MRYLLLFLILPLTAAPVYRFCDPSSEDCSVQHTVRQPTLEEQLGLSNEAFQEWFAVPYNFVWTITDSSADGVIIGRVRDTGQHYTSEFVFQAGILHCCWADIPFRLHDINTAGFIVGGWFGYDSPVFCPPGTLACEHNQPLILAPGVVAPGMFFSSRATLLTIDDRNWIESDYGVLVPVPIPEPSTYAMVIFALLVLGAYRFRHVTIFPSKLFPMR